MKKNIQKIYTLTPMQEGMLFHSLNKDSNAYFSQIFYTIEDDFNPEILAKSVDFLSLRHDIFRTAFVYEETENPIQVVLENRRIAFFYEDLSARGEQERLDYLAHFRTEDKEKGFDLTKDVLLRLYVFKTADQSYHFLWSFHHILIDGWCHSILVKELTTIYNCLSQDKAVDLPPAIPYRNYINWLGQQDAVEAKNYWTQQLSQYSTVARIPVFENSTTSELQSPTGREVLQLSKKKTSELEILAQKQKTSLSTLFQTVWGILLARYTNSRDVVYGKVVSGRPAELEHADQIMGLFINTIPQRVKFDVDTTFEELLRQVHQESIDNLPYHYSSLAEIQSQFKEELIHHIVVFQNFRSEFTHGDDHLLNIKDFQVTEESNYFLDVDVEIGDRLKITLSYLQKCYPKNYIQQITTHLEHLIDQVLAQPTCKVEEMQLMTEQQQEQLLTAFNGTEIDLDNNKPINVRFEDCVTKTPSAIAIIHNGEQWTYEEVNQKANQIADTLKAMGLKPQDFVGVHLERNAVFICAMLGILKSGGVYIPLDTQNPIDRTQKMILQSSPKVIITANALLENLESCETNDILLVDTYAPTSSKKAWKDLKDQNDLLKANSQNPVNLNEMESWAYMLYTSGTTGQPKGAITRHEGALNHILAEYVAMELPDGFRFLQSASIASDISIWQMLAPVLKGGAVVIIDKMELLDYERLVEVMVEEKVSLVEFVPSYSWGLMDYLKNNSFSIGLKDLQWVMLVGEKVPVALVNEWKINYPKVRILNGYGPCEASDDITQFEVKTLLPKHYQRVPIGQPIDNMNIVILDERGQVCPIGIAGELCVSGVGVGVGYWGMPERTALSFVPNPFAYTLGDILYKTGDLASWMPDGNIDFLGRIDRQVKIRGHRVEPGEVDALLISDPKVKDCFTQVYQPTEKDTHLVAFIVLEESEQVEADSHQSAINYFNETCRQVLPIYMQPKHYCFITDIPRNLSDKVDEKALRLYYEEAQEHLPAATAGKPCSTETEQELYKIWTKILDREGIGADDDFFEIGGHSLLAMRVKSAVQKKLNVRLNIRDLFTYKTIETLGHQVDTLASGAVLPAITKQSVSTPIPLSFAQERLWFVDKLEGTVFYHLTDVYYFFGKLDLKILKAAFQKVVNRHSILRTVYKENLGQGYQEILDKDGWDLSYTDATNFADENEQENFIKQVQHKPFDLANDHMLRVHLLRMSEEEHKMVLVMHHIASDGWSESILLNEVVEIFKAYQENRTPELTPLPVQYADYAIWQRQHQTEEILKDKLAYWDLKLSDVEPLELPTDYPRPPIQSSNGNLIHFKINQKLKDKLLALCQKEEVTLFVLLLSVFKVMLARYAGQTDICIGSPVANRLQEELEPLIGFFLNTLILRSDLSENPGFNNVLKDVKNTVLEAFDNEEVPFEKIVDRVVKTRDRSRSPLAQVIFVLQNTPQTKVQQIGDLQLSVAPNDKKTSNFDLHLSATEVEDHLQMEFTYCTDLFSLSTVERMAEHFQMLLSAVVANPTQAIGQLKMLLPAEVEQIQTHFNDTQADYPQAETIISLFNQQAKKRPTNTALIFENRKLNYSELAKKVNSLSTALTHTYGMQKGDLVGLILDRSPEMIISLLAILQSGGAYVPLDPKYPQKRIDYILKDSGVQLVLIDDTIGADVLENYKGTLVHVADCLEKEKGKELPYNELTVEPEDTAYIIYTSGTTGQPKGCLLSHRNVVRLMQNEKHPFDFSAADTWIMAHSYCFDFSVWEMYGALLNGGALVIPKWETVRNPERFINALKTHQVSVLNQTPRSFYNLIKVEENAETADLDQHLRYVIFGGEKLEPHYLNDWVKRYDLEKVKLINMYGITETTVHVTHHQIKTTDLENRFTSIIGKPLPETEVYILDEFKNLCAVGIKGEIYVGGSGLAKGYLNKETLTKERFVNSPLASDKRWYRTGDLGRWSENGNIEYLGRKDHQVKIRGYRIELGEIESVLQKAPSVDKCIVIANDDENGNKRLIAYIVANGIYDKTIIQNYIKAHLPNYMIPALMMELEAMPLNANGKVNRKALPNPDASQLLTNEYVAPRNEIEEKLASVWKDLLRIEKVGIHDNFFELGGDSIITIQVVSRARMLGCHFNPHDLFTNQTIAQLASVIETQTKSNDNVNQEQLDGIVPFAPIQQWFLEKDFDEKNHYNQAVLLQVDKDLNEDHLNQVIQALLSYHDALRFSYTMEEAKIEQSYGDYTGQLEIKDLSTLSASSWSLKLDEISNKYQKNLDLSAGKLINAVLIKTPGQENANRLLVVVHHLAIDGVSWRILLDDIEIGLQQLAEKKPLDFGAKTNSYRTWVEALQAQATSPSITAQSDLWQAIAGKNQPLPSSSTPITTSKKEVVEHLASLDKELTDFLLKETNQAYNTQINDILLSALAQTFSDWTGREEIVYGLEGHGRDMLQDLDISRTVGWFTNLYPLALSVEKNWQEGQLIKEVKEQLRLISDKGMAYGLLRYMHPDEAVRNQMSKVDWSIVFNYLGQLDNIVSNSKWFKAAKESVGESRSDQYPFGNKIEINSFISEGQLNLSWSFSNQYFTEETISQLADQYLENISRLIKHCKEQTRTKHTPSDFALAPLISVEDLDAFMEERNAEGVARGALLSSVYRLSPLQEGMLFHGLYDRNSLAYLGQYAFDFPEGLDVAVFKAAWEYVVENHTILRTGFFYDRFSVPVQCVYKKVALPIATHYFSHLDETELQAAVQEFLAKDLEQKFEFNQAPLMRIQLLEMAKGAYKMVWTFHHIILDGWSISILLEELLLAYDNVIHNRPLPTKAEDRYEDLIHYVQSKDAFIPDTFWKNYMDGFKEATLLPFVNSGDRNRMAGIYKVVNLDFDSLFTEKVRGYVQFNHLTVNTLVQGIWATLLSYYTQNKDVTFGVTVSGRPTDLPTADQGVGMYINTLPLRVQTNKEDRIVDYLLNIQKEHSQSRAYQHSSLNDIQKNCGIQGDFLDTHLVFENYPVGEILSQDWILKIENPYFFDQNNFPLSIEVTYTDQIYIVFRYNSNLLQESYVEMIKGHFTSLLKQIVETEKEQVSSLEILTPVEQKQVLENFNNTKTPYPNEHTIAQLFEAQVAQRPDQVALVFDGKEMTYQELNEKANRLAHYLQKTYELKADDKIGVMLERSEWTIITLLAILKAGAAYVPIPLTQPIERKRFFIEDTQLKALVIHSDQLFDVIELEVNILSVDIQYETIANDFEATNPQNDWTSAEDLAYVIYTSGSTGKPKGVLTRNQAVARLLFNPSFDFLGPDTTLYQYAPLAFDASTFEVWAPLLHGGRLVISSPGLKTLEAIASDLAKEKVNILWLTAGLFHQATDTCMELFGNLKYILAGGDSIQPLSVSKILQAYPELVFINGYGPTESTTFAIVNRVGHIDELDLKVNTIGKPIGNTQIYILDKDTVQPLAIGVTGEIFIGGDGLAKGYLNNPELTAEKFISNPFDPTTRLYRTGDLGRWLADGKIEFLGRKDHQVKVRGYRIELGEIETVLQKAPAVGQCIVLAQEDANANKRLIAYVVADGDFDKTAIERYLKDYLPEYMIPSVIMELESMPLTDNGKVDRRAFPNPDASELQADHFIAPQTDVEKRLAQIWEDLLDIEKVGTNDNFFALGGHSLLATRAVSAIRKEFAKEIDITAIFMQPTMGALAQLIEEHQSKSLLPEIVVESRPMYIPLSYAQERLWFINKLEGSVHYHIPTILRFTGDLDVESLSHAFRSIVNRHEVLRTVFKEEELVHQVVLPKDQWQLTCTEISSEAAARDYIESQIDQAFDLSQDHMLKAHLIKLSDQESLLVMVMHHIASDGWSQPILVQELVEYYQSKQENRSPNLTDLSIQYIDFAMWQRKHLSATILEEKLNYWERQLSGLAYLDLPTDFPRPMVQSISGKILQFQLNKQLSEALANLSKSQDVTLFMTLLSLFKVLMYRYSGQSDVCIGSPIANRTQSEIEPLIGFFLNMLALRSDLKGNPTFEELLANVKDTTLEAYNHQEVPFENIVNRVATDRERSHSPIFQVVLVLQNNKGIPEVNLDGLVLKEEKFEHATSQYDLTFDVLETDNGLQIDIEYCDDLFHAVTVERMMESFETLVTEVIVNPELPIDNIKLLSSEEEEKIIDQFGHNSYSEYYENTLTELFVKQAKTSPENIALVFEDQKLTYADLDKQSDHLAHYLQSEGVGPEILVGICIDRSIEMLVGILGILKAGGGFVPIDPTYPKRRIERMLSSTIGHLVLTSTAHKNLFKEPKTLTAFCLDSWLLTDKEPAEPVFSKATTNNIAYLIYTSGTTGEPKGVEICHSAIVNEIKYSTKYYDLTEADRILQTSNYVFDAAIEQMFLALLQGATLVLLSKDTLLSSQSLEEIIESEKISHLDLTPSLLQNIRAKKYPALKRILSGGEVVPLALAQTWSPFVQFYNVYGPAEATITSSIYHYSPDVDTPALKSLPIGKPLGNTEIYILDQDYQIAPIGVVGELYIGGAGLARGYRKDPVLTAQKFIVSPFDSSKKLYNTGDRACWLYDGNVEFKGRADDQVKIRGQRVEMGEIENALKRAIGIAQNVVLVKEDAQDVKRLLAYIVPTGEYSEETVFRYLKEELPGYMIPSLLIELPEMPINEAGKVDKSALPIPDLSQAFVKQYQAPRNDTESQIAQIWATLLNVKQVGVYDNFFELGGHSLLAMRMIAAIRTNLEIELNVRDVFQYTSIADLSNFILSQNITSGLKAIEVQKRPSRIPLSFAQERLWFIDQLGGSVPYHMPTILDIEGPLSQEMMEKAFREIMQRHEVLRTVIKSESGLPYQEIQTDLNWKVDFVKADDWSKEALNDLVQELIAKPFQLSHDWPLRVTLIDLGSEKQILVVVFHHIVSDGWSSNLLINEFTQLYSAYVKGSTPVLPKLSVQYADYAIWQRSNLSGANYDRQLAYWKKQLDGVQALEMPTDFPRPAVQSNQGAHIDYQMDSTLTKNLQELANAKGISFYMLLLSALKVLLYRYSGQEDICIGSPVAGRTHKEVEELIGFFVNTVAIRTQLSGNPKFSDLLLKVKDTTLTAYDNQVVPFEQVVEAVSTERDMSRSAIFQTIFNLVNIPDSADSKLENLRIEYSEIEALTAKTDLIVTAEENELGMNVGITYCKDLYTKDTIAQILKHYEKILSEIVRRSAIPIDELILINEEETKELVQEFGQNPFEVPTDATLVSLFTAQAKANPAATALVFGKESMTYGELDKKSDQLAAYLISKGLGLESLVGICMDRSMETIVSIFGILKAGGAYVPIDPAYPVQRIYYMLEDTQIQFLIAHNRYTKLFAAYDQLDLIDIDQWEHYITSNASEIELNVKPDNLAYVLYTSGSTGRPKGVLIEHRSVVNELHFQADNFSLDKSDRILQTANYVFDASVEQIFLPLMFGATLVLITKDVLMDKEALERVLTQENITHLHATPSLLQIVEIKAYPNLRRVLSGGETCAVELAKDWSPYVDFYNKYGPTETTINSTIYRFDPNKEYHSLPIGRPLGNTEIFIVDKNLQLVPKGVIGEICIGGAGLARAYINQETLNQQKFITSPFDAQQKWYRTGDFACWLPNGNIEFKGRFDDQVKLRGQRIELGEIESCLQKYPAIARGIVTIRKEDSDSGQLVAYVVPRAAYDKMELQEYLKTELPEYMIPSVLIELEKLPLTENGKVDKALLPAPDLEDLRPNKYLAPRSVTEEKIADVWKELLKVDKVGIEDNFFELGGHSLLAIRVVSALKEKLDADITIRDLFQQMTVANLASLIDKQEKSNVLPAILRQDKTARIPLSFAQERLWFIDQFQGSVAYHIPKIFRLHGTLNRTALEFAFQQLLQRHEILRTIIKSENGLAYQEIGDSQEWTLLQNKWETNAIENIINTPFNLSKEFPIRVALMEKSEVENILVVVVHHIASDAWSSGLMIEEFSTFYNAYAEEQEVDLPALAIQYADFAMWQRQNLEGTVLVDQLAFWKNQLQEVPPLNLPVDFPRPAEQSRRGDHCLLKLDTLLVKRLETLATQNEVTTFILLLAAFKTLLFRYSGQKDLCVGVPIAGRSSKTVEPLIGFFVNSLAMRSQINNAITFEAYLQVVKETTLDAFANQIVPFEQVVEALGVKRDLSQDPIFQVVFNLVNTTEQDKVKMNGLEVEALSSNSYSAQRDLDIIVVEGEHGMTIEATYCKDLFKSSTIEKMLSHFEVLLLAISQSPEIPISDLTMLSQGEQQQLLEVFNDTTVAYPKEMSIVEIFEAQVKQSPKAIALVFEGQTLTYSALHKKSTQMARFLKKQKVKKEDRVAICMDRSLEMIIAILSILKVGAAYVPIESGYPQKRIHYILEDAEVQVILLNGKYRQLFDHSNESIIIDLQKDKKAIEAESTRKIRMKRSGENLAYLMYTSGTTGEPKGVLINHYSISRLIFNPSFTFLNSSSVLYQYAPLAFDASTFEIWGAILKGGKLVISNPELKTLDAIAVDLKKDKVNVLWLTASLFHLAVDTCLHLFGDLDYIMAGGETVHPDRIQKVLETHQDLTFINGYGPTESTTFTTIHKIDSSEAVDPKVNNIGRPIGNTQIYILAPDSILLLPPGVEGEICIGGDGLARGYLNKPILTQEKFVTHPFVPDQRIYRTGDIGRWLPDGSIEYIGRVDDQVKIRGYRIELGEIETIIQHSNMVSKNVVLAKTDAGANKQLIAYVVAKEGFDKPQLEEYLQANLPQYMIPSLILELEEIPLTANGKVNKDALPTPDLSFLQEDQYVAPNSDTEIIIAEIWQELLNVSPISIRSNFFELGGHSLLSMRVISAIRNRLQIELSIRDLFVYTTIESLAKFVDTQQSPNDFGEIKAGDRPEKIPLSFAQERLWFIDQLAGSVQYHIPIVLRIKGGLDVNILKSAFKDVIHRHEVLRTVLKEEEGLIYQEILPEGEWKINQEQNLSLQSDELLEEYLNEQIQLAFDLSSDHPIRATLVEVGNQEFILVLIIHHIASDGWSNALMIEEFTHCYFERSKGRLPQLPGLEFQYADFAIWEKGLRNKKSIEKDLEYWSGQLERVPTLELPTDFPRPAIQSIQGAHKSISLPISLSEELGQLAKTEEVTMSMLLLSAFKSLLFRYSGQEDICIGTPIAGRRIEEAESLIGFFVNTLAIRSYLDDTLSFQEYLQQVKEITLDAYKHQSVPFEQVLEHLGIERDMSRSPISQVMFNFLNTPEEKIIDLENIDLEYYSKGSELAQRDLDISIVQSDSGLELSVTYCTALYTSETIDRMLTHYQNLLTAIVATPSQSIGALQMLSQEEEEQLLFGFNNTAVEYPKHASLVTHFEEQVKLTPDKTALVFNGQTMSYQMLNDKANQVAQCLKAEGIQTEERVALLAYRGFEMIIGIWGILKCGAVYVPLNNDYPLQRLQYILEDAGIKQVLYSSKKLLQNSGLEGYNFIDIKETNTYSTNAVDVITYLGDPAYVMYTSGTTGEPKGILVSQQNILKLALEEGPIAIHADDRVLQWSNFSFDGSTYDIYSTLLNGATLYLISELDAPDAKRLSRIIEDHDLSVAFITTALFNALVDTNLEGLEKIRKILFGGELVSVNHVKRAFEFLGSEVIVHVYGPTETTVYASYYPVDACDRDYVPIGRPLSNTNIYVLNTAGQVAGIGVTGEIWIGGDGVAQGYLNRPELTAQKFLLHQLNDQLTSRLYRTGDLARMLPDGNIDFIGRKDSQVKMRGYRIELGEIEIKLHEAPGIKQAVVMAKEEVGGTKYLVAYIVPDSKYDRSIVEEYLKSQLPDYMVPSRIMDLPKLPLNKNGKVDKKALPEPEIATLQTSDYVEPENEMQVKLIAIWKELLGVEQIGIEDNFFELGGHSLMATRLAAHIEKEFSLTIPLRTLFQYPKISGLSKYMRIMDTEDKQEDEEEFELFDL